MSIRLNILAEGLSEEQFINRMVKPFLSPKSIFVYVHCITTKRDKQKGRTYRGGMVSYETFRNDLYRWIRQEGSDKSTHFSMMVDLYRFPRTESPYNITLDAIQNIYHRVQKLEDNIFKDVSFDRFIPYIQLHEFETFVLCEPERLMGYFPGREKDVATLVSSIRGIPNPEEIDDKEGPSKRIMAHLSGYQYQKATIGPLIAEDIGLDRLRKSCRHFDAWISKLESLSG